MIINIGSTNQVKIEAVKETISDYKFLQGSTIQPQNVSSEVRNQPLSLEETITGAKNRARSAFTEQCNYSIGLESGLYKSNHAKAGYLDICVCAVYDGENFSLGFSQPIEFPINLTNAIINEGIDANQAANKTELTSNDSIGSKEGIVGIITKGKVTRKEHTKQAIRGALIHLENPTLY
ncbi:inosine/xanthosine triphosphatase [Candidatus Pacearchaeota archaeon]|jgi:inosine/xanthosine triphosphatase|nr:inosine/xanthosine triphosphatase [Candidatus Pacearchaeota archaeon]|tara:strand:- start:542 stop:1078 length:537 start_codon:yes stop_codon:yes gene_type:complete